MRSILLGWALSLSLLAMPATAQSFPKLAGNPVVDQADIIPAAEEAALNTQFLDLEKRTGHQLVVATVSDLGFLEMGKPLDLEDAGEPPLDPTQGMVDEHILTRHLELEIHHRGPARRGRDRLHVIQRRGRQRAAVTGA